MGKSTIKRITEESRFFDKTIDMTSDDSGEYLRKAVDEVLKLCNYLAIRVFKTYNVPVRSDQNGNILLFDTDGNVADRIRPIELIQRFSEDFAFIPYEIRHQYVPEIKVYWDSDIETIKTVFAVAIDEFVLWALLNIEWKLTGNDTDLLNSRIWELEERLNKPYRSPGKAATTSDYSYGEEILRRLEVIKSDTSEIKGIGTDVNIIKSDTSEIKDTVHDIAKSLRSLNQSIESLQKVTEERLNRNMSQDQAESIISEFTDEYMSKLDIYIKKETCTTDYSIELKKLKISFGDNAWNKMSDKSKTFLASAKVMFNQLLSLEDIVDYSGVCILVTKALETELKERFYYGFVKYLRNRNVNIRNYPRTLVYKNDKTQQFSLLHEDKYTLGSVHTMLGCNPNKFNSKDKKILEDYLRDELMDSTLSDQKRFKIANDFGKDILKVCNQYRNPSAHTNELKRIDAKNCMDFIIDSQKLLKKILEEFLI